MQEKERYYSLDMVKFIASIAIMFHHYQQMSGIQFRYINFCGGKFYVGSLVELFFLLSGFFAANMRVGVQKGDFFRYIKGKIIRLYPMCAFATIAYSGVIWMYYLVTHTWWKEYRLGLWNFLSSLLLIHESGPVGNIGIAANNVTWYICVLLICYIIHWLLIWLADRLQANPIYFYIAMIFVGITVHTYGIAKPFFNDGAARGYYGYFGGIILWNVYKKWSKESHKWWAGAILVCCALAAYINYTEFFEDVSLILTFVVFPCVVFLCLYSKCIKKLFHYKLFGELGKISFEIYVWHVPVYVFIELVCVICKVPFPHSLKTMLVYGAGVVILAILMYKFVEVPVYNWLKNKGKA